MPGKYQWTGFLYDRNLRHDRVKLASDLKSLFYDRNKTETDFFPSGNLK